jgi:hypothetical protein
MMKRPTRVPASSTVRMKTASNMIAKWYQIAYRPSPNAEPKMWAMPTASDGAPPVRPKSVVSPMWCASDCICAASTGNPQAGNGRCRRRWIGAHHAGGRVDREIDARVEHAARRSAP